MPTPGDDAAEQLEAPGPPHDGATHDGASDDGVTDDGPPDGMASPDHDRARLRLPLRLLAFGAPGAFVVSFLTSLVGADGRTGAFVFLMLLAITLGGTGILVMVQLIMDDRAKRPTGGRRGVLAFALFVLTYACMQAVGGLVGPAA